MSEACMCEYLLNKKIKDISKIVFCINSLYRIWFTIVFNHTVNTLAVMGSWDS